MPPGGLVSAPENFLLNDRDTMNSKSERGQCGKNEAVNHTDTLN